MAELGRAYIDVHADTDPFERELPRGIDRAADDAEKMMDGIGKGWGDKLADATTKELGRHGGDFEKVIRESVDRVDLGGGLFRDRNGRLHNSLGRFVSEFGNGIEEEIESAFMRAGRSGGPIDRIGTGFADAIGAAFNVSGRSPLISLLAIGVGYIGGVIGAAIQAANALVAIITTVPALLAAIGLQIGTIAIAFDGVGKAVQGAFAATNAYELQEAVKGLTPPAQEFVKSLLPLRDIFNNIKAVVQSNFFAALGDTVPRIVDALAPIVGPGMARLATALGSFFRGLGIFFSSPAFVSFVRDVFPATAKWLSSFSPVFINTLRALIQMADHAIPFLSRLGSTLNHGLTAFADWLDGMVKSGSFDKWLQDMGTTIDSIANLFFYVAGFVASFFDALNKAGGNELIDALSDSFEQLAFVLASPVGKDALESLIAVFKIAIYVLTGLIDIVFLMLAAFNLAGESLREFWRFLSQEVGPAIGTFFTETLPNALKSAWNAVAGFFSDLWFKIQMAWAQFTDSIATKFNEFKAWVSGIPGRIVDAIGDLSGLLWAKGQSLIQGFINGIKSMWADLKNTASNLASTITDFLPGSPAKMGPLSGQGYALYRGQRMVQDLMKGMAMEGAALSSTATTTATQIINFGGIRVEANGATPAQARTAGEAVGNGVTNQMAMRDVRLQVRMT